MFISRYGGQGCRGTQPSRAYNYIRAEGLPARDEYTPYKPKVLPFSITKQTHYNGKENYRHARYNILARHDISHHTYKKVISLCDITYYSVVSIE